jgi:uncharacterized protein YjbI with pentapeptide repeats
MKSLRKIVVFLLAMSMAFLWVTPAKADSCTPAKNSYLQDCWFSGLDLRNADLSGSDFTGSTFLLCNLTGARFDNSDLSEVDFYSDAKSASFRSVDLFQAKMSSDFSSSDFSNAYLGGTDFTLANLTQAKFNFARGYAIFDYANLTGAVLDDADFSLASFESANLLNASISNTHFESANFNYIKSGGLRGTVTYPPSNEWTIRNGYWLGEYADLSDASLADAQLIGLKLNNAIFDDADLRSANLSQSNLRYASFDGTDLSSANLENANLQNAWFLEADLSQSNLYLADLSNTLVEKTSLVNADLTSAYLSNTRFFESDLTKATLNYATLIMTNLTTSNLTDVIADNLAEIWADLPVHYSFYKNSIVRSFIKVGKITLGGLPKLNKTLTAAVGTWDKGTKFTYQWLRNGVAISKAKSKTYKIVRADLNKKISCRVLGSAKGRIPTTKLSNSLKVIG